MYISGSHPLLLFLRFETDNSFHVRNSTYWDACVRGQGYSETFTWSQRWEPSFIEIDALQSGLTQTMLFMMRCCVDAGSSSTAIECSESISSNQEAPIHWELCALPYHSVSSRRTLQACSIPKTKQRCAGRTQSSRSSYVDSKLRANSRTQLEACYFAMHATQEDTPEDPKRRHLRGQHGGAQARPIRVRVCPLSPPIGVDIPPLRSGSSYILVVAMLEPIYNHYELLG
ncbi:hypothetical protein CPB85DRAFT_210866 [Mucidula mucida]|nr:hypothetical protein CPB85DRAFT_210866 [Mucidula mucida]